MSIENDKLTEEQDMVKRLIFSSKTDKNFVSTILKTSFGGSSKWLFSCTSTLVVCISLFVVFVSMWRCIIKS